MGRRGLIRPPWWGVAGLAATAALLVGCGSRTPAPQLLRPAAPGGFLSGHYQDVGFSVAWPRRWTALTAHPPLVALISSGPAVLSLWRYRPLRPTPATPDQLGQALRRLEAAARSRDPGLRVLGSSTGSVGRFPAVELETIQRIHGAPRQVYSTHVYRPREEVVLEEYAPVGLFPELERTVFSDVRRSLAVTGR